MGFEPMTCGLRNRCSATEPRWQADHNMLDYGALSVKVGFHDPYSQEGLKQ